MLTNCLAACAHLTITVSEIQRDIGRKSSIFSYPLHLVCQLSIYHSFPVIRTTITENRQAHDTFGHLVLFDYSPRLTYDRAGFTYKSLRNYVVSSHWVRIRTLRTLYVYATAHLGRLSQ